MALAGCPRVPWQVDRSPTTLPERFPELLAESVQREALACREEELHDRFGGDLPTLSAFLSSRANGRENYECRRRFPTNERSRSESSLSVTCCCCQALMSKEALHVTQVGSCLVKQQRCCRMPQGMCGNDRHPSTLACKLDPGVKCLVAKGSAVPTGKDERRSREVHSPAPKPHALHTFQESEPFLEQGRQFLCDGQITKGAAFDLEACSDNHPTGFTDEAVQRKPCPANDRQRRPDRVNVGSVPMPMGFIGGGCRLQ
jgi:hypothetical protein